MSHDSLTLITQIILCTMLLALLAGCAAPRPGSPLERRGDEISVAGRLFHSGTRVVLWYDPGGYDAYRPHRFFEPDEVAPSRAPDRVARFGSLRGGLPGEIGARVRKRGWTLEDLREVVTEVVIHYDVCGTSRRCFEVLHDIRGLSCHFLLDLDGTLYQTLDLKERAWHAGAENDRSVGIEIANIGAYPDDRVLGEWYREEKGRTRVALPEGFGDGGLPEGFVARPARPGPIRGTIHGRELMQQDFTEEQYRALEKLLVTLCRVLPAVSPRIPRAADGEALTTLLPDGLSMEERPGIIGHLHISEKKIDPGPAFDWDRIERALRRARLR